MKIPTFPQPTMAVGYKARLLEAGDELELSDEDGKRLMDAGVVESFNAANTKARKPVTDKQRARAKV